MFDFSVLEQFIAFYHTGTLIEAAEQLHISQSTLTRSMQKLESEFGVPLFRRTKNSITLTEAGKMAAIDAEMILHQYKNMLYRIQDYDRRNRTIYIGSCAPVPITRVSPPLTNLFQSSTISSELGGISDLMSGLQENKYQLIILPAKAEEDGLYSIPICKEQIFFCLHKKHRLAKRKSISTSEMNEENMLLLQDIGFWYDLVKEKMPDSRFLMQTDRYNFIELAVNSTMPFFATKSLDYARAETDRIWVPIKDPEFTVTYHLVCKKENKKKFDRLFDQIRSNSR